MSHSIDKIEEFIQLRAVGKSFDEVSKKIAVSKPTLIEWSKKFKLRLEETTNLHLDYLRKKYSVAQEKRIENLGKNLEKIQKEIALRDLDVVPTDRLFELVLKFQSALKNEEAFSDNNEQLQPCPTCANHKAHDPWKFNDVG